MKENMILTDSDRFGKEEQAMRKDWTKQGKSDGIGGGIVRFGVSGTGLDAEKFCQSNRFLRRFELAAVCGETAKAAEEFCVGKGRPLLFDDPARMASCQELDAVYLTKDVMDRHDQCILMMLEGKHVLCAAPMADSLEELTELFRVAEDHHVILLESFPFLYTPSFQKMIPYLDSLGTIRHATFQNCYSSVSYERWKRGIPARDFTPETAIGGLLEAGTIPVAAMIRLFGYPEKIRGLYVTLRDSIDVTGSILMVYEGMIGEVIYSKITDAAMPSQIQGEEGSMILREIDNIKDLSITRRGVRQAVHFEQSDNVFHYETEAFLRMTDTGKGWKKSRKLSRHTMKVLQKVREQNKRKEQKEVSQQDEITEKKTEIPNGEEV